MLKLRKSKQNAIFAIRMGLDSLISKRKWLQKLKIESLAIVKIV